MEAGDAPRVLVVDDEPTIIELLSVSMRFQGFEVATAGDGREAVRIAPELAPDVIVLDVMMPGLDGFATLTKLRDYGVEAPVLFLTARDAVEDRVRGLTDGADDYVTKPFSLEEVIARVRVLLRRGPAVQELLDEEVLTFEDIELYDDAHEVFKAGSPVELSPTEFSLLRYLMLNAGVVLSKAKILDNVWHYDFGGDGNIVETYISYLRRKVDTGEQPLIHTVRGVGYVLRKPR